MDSQTIDITNHTPTPWMQSSEDESIVYFVGAEGREPGICHTQSDLLDCLSPERAFANAAFIVTACNAYDANQAAIQRQAETIKALVDALEWSDRSLCAYLDYAPQNIKDSCYDPAGAHFSNIAALKLAKGE